MPVEDIDDARIAGAMAHPLRLAILWQLEHGPASPSELSRRLDARLERISYHVRRLHELGLVAADEPEVLDANVRHTYRLVSWPRITEEAWAGMPVASRRAFAQAVVERSAGLADASIADGGADRPDALVCRRPMTLDEAGFEEASAILQEALERLADVERRAAERLTRPGARRLDGTAVVLLFETRADDGSP